MAIDENDVPTAIQFVGRAADEGTPLALAAQIETSRPFPRWSLVKLDHLTVSSPADGPVRRDR